MQQRLFDIGWSDEEKVSVKLVTRRKAQKSTGSAIAQNGSRSAGRSQRPPEKWEQKERKLQRKSGSGKEVLPRILSVKANEQRPFQPDKVGV